MTQKIEKQLIVHTVSDEDVTVTAEIRGKTTQAKVPGISVELIDKATGRAHTHVFDEDVKAIRDRLVPGASVTMTLTVDETPTKPDPAAARKFAQPALRDEDKTDSQRDDESKAQAKIAADKK